MINEYIQAARLPDLVADGHIATQAPGPGQHAPVALIVDYGAGVRVVVPDGTTVEQLRSVGAELAALGTEEDGDAT